MSNKALRHFANSTETPLGFQPTGLVYDHGLAGSLFKDHLLLLISFCFFSPSLFFTTRFQTFETVQSFNHHQFIYQLSDQFAAQTARIESVSQLITFLSALSNLTTI
jgi:hypothetical protein